MIEFQLNGQLRSVQESCTIADLLDREGWAQRRVAVECNGQIVPRSQHAVYAVNSGDRIEVVQAMGGG